VFPVLLRFGDWSVSTLGLLYAVGVLAAFLWALRRAPGMGVARKTVCDAAIITMLGFLAGGRLHYVLQHWARFRGDLPAVADLSRGGTAQYGGIVLMIFGLLLYARWRRQPAADLGAVLAAPVLLAVAIGRLGCYAQGCCFGRPTDGPLGVCFPPDARASRVGRDLLDAGGDGTLAPALHPTQLYSAGGALLGLLLLVWLQRRGAARGVLVGTALGALGLSRLVVDQFRYYEPSVFFLGWPINCWISATLLCAGVILVVRSSSSRRS